jgi:hypothetical protein
MDGTGVCITIGTFLYAARPSHESEREKGSGREMEMEKEKGSGREMEMEKEKVGTDLYYRTYVGGGNRTWDTPHHTTHIMFTRSRSLSSSP